MCHSPWPQVHSTSPSILFRALLWAFSRRERIAPACRWPRHYAGTIKCRSRSLRGRNSMAGWHSRGRTPWTGVCLVGIGLHRDKHVADICPPIKGFKRRCRCLLLGICGRIAISRRCCTTVIRLWRTCYDAAGRVHVRPFITGGRPDIGHNSFAPTVFVDHDRMVRLR